LKLTPEQATRLLFMKTVSTMEITVFGKNDEGGRKGVAHAAQSAGGA